MSFQRLVQQRSSGGIWLVQFHIQLLRSIHCDDFCATESYLDAEQTSEDVNCSNRLVNTNVLSWVRIPPRNMPVDLFSQNSGKY